MVVSGAVFVGLLAIPAVQGWLLKRALTGRPGWRVNFDHFGAGPSGVDVSGLDFAMPGVEAKSAPIVIELTPWRLVSRREIRIERIEMSKLRVLLTPAHLSPDDATAPKAAKASKPFGGVLAQVPTTWPLSLGTAQLDGEIVVNDGGRSVVAGTFNVHGGGVSAEQTGALAFELAVNSALLPPGPANQLRSNGTVSLSLDAEHRATRLTLDGDLTLPDYGSLVLPPGKFSVTVEPAAGGEKYHAELHLGTAAVLVLDGQLDAANSRLTGHATIRADQSLAAGLKVKNLPAVALDGGADFSLDLRTGDLDVNLAGNLDAHDWAALLPQLAVVDAFKGRLTAALTRRAGTLSVNRFEATLQGATSPAIFKFELTDPLDPLHPPQRPLARLTLEHWPLHWVNPWLAPARVQLGPAEFSGQWTLAPTPALGLRLTPVYPCTLGPVALVKSPVPVTPIVNFTFSPVAELSAQQLSVTIEDFIATASHEDKVDGRVAVAFTLANHTLHATGALHGTLPSLLAGAGKNVPFTLNTLWDITQSGRQLRIDKLGFSARRDAKVTPYVSLRFLQPLSLDLDHLKTAVTGKNAEWLRLRFQHLPLAWVSRWFPAWTIGGDVIEGETVLHSAPDGRLTLDSAVPWRVADLSIAVGGRTFFEGGGQMAPMLDFGAGHGTFRLAGMTVESRTGERVTGSIAFDAILADRQGSTAVAFDVDLPALPHSAETFGPIHAVVRARLHNQTSRLVAVDELALKINNRGGELFSLEATQPFLFGLSNNGVFTTATLSPLRLKVEALPLAWLRPWTGKLVLDGTLQPCDLLLTAQFTKYQLRAQKPVHVRDFAAVFDGREMARDTEFSFYPGLDLDFNCVPLPKFILAYSATAYLTDGAIDVGGRRAVDLDLALNLLGNTGRLLPNSLELSSRVDFGPLSAEAALAARGIPRAGTLVTRINGGLLGHDPLEVWGRLEGVPAANGQGTIPTFEFSAHGQLSPEQTLTADVALGLATSPQPTDARFEAAFNLNQSNLVIASGFHSSFIDVNGLLALVTAFLPPAKSASTPPPVAASSPPKPSRLKYTPKPDQPLWGPLRGRFELDIATLQYAPYRIDGVRGRLDLRDRELVLSDLSGAMFAGRWGGRLQLDYRPENPASTYEVAGEFGIEQFDSARVVQTVFRNELASVEAHLNIKATAHSRGNLPLDLINRAEVTFTAEGGPGVVRLQVPKQDAIATAVVFGGSILLSPELRALGRLLKKFAEMPVDTVHVAGQRTTNGEVTLQELRIQSPQARLLAHGRIAASDEPLMQHPLEMSFDLAAKDDTAVILSGMSLLRWKPDDTGYRPMKEPFAIGGKVGQPDTRPLYDLLAKAVGGSKGTWGMLMRKLQDEVNKKKNAPPKKTVAPPSP